MANIKDKIAQIRQAIFGKEVRESIASGIEAINKEVENTTARQDNVEAQFQAVLDETTDKDVISAPEITAARVGADNTTHSNLKARLDTEHQQVMSHLAEIKNLENYELNSKGRQKKAFTIFRSDDGRVEEYTHALPLFNAKGVPQNIAIVSDWVGRPNFLSKEQLLELQNVHGWEILSHSKTHPTHSDGRTMIPDLPERDARYELRQSRDDLRQMGLDVESYAVVGGQYNTRDRQLFREYYRSALTSAPGRYRGLNQTPITTHDMYTYWIDPTAGDLMEFLTTESKAVAIQKILQNAYEAIDYASEHGGILIFGTHYRYIASDADYTQMYSDLIDYAKSKTKVTTLSDALNNYGNIVEIGDNASLTSNQNSDKRARTNHFVVGIDGKTSGGNLAEVNEYNGETDWREFPLGVTITPITSEVAIESNLPEGSAGVLTNYKLVPSPLQHASFNYQTYRIARSKREYYRVLDGNLNFGAWHLNSPGLMLHEQQANSLVAGIKSYGPGITYSNITSDHPEISLAPDGKPGLVITQITNKSRPGYNIQIYYPVYETDKTPYIRRGLSETEWTGWSKLTQSRIRSGDENDYDTSTGIVQFPVGVTLTAIGADHPDVSNTPTGGPGTLTTYKVHASGLVGRSYQEFHAFQTGDTFKRVPTGNSTWSDWKKYVMETI